MKRLFVWLIVLAVLGMGLPVRAAAPEENLVQTADGSWGSSRDAMAGESILCRAVLTMPQEGEGVYTCRLSPGLRFESFVGVQCAGEWVNAAFYTLITARQEGAAFSLHLSPLAAAPGERLTVEYTLRLNDSAEAENTFSLGPDGENGEPGRVRCFSLTAQRSMVLGSAGQQNPVSGACLCLSYDPAGRERVAFRQRGEDRYLACAARDCGHSRHQYVLKTPRSGRIYLEGLAAGTYYLCETRPAEGMSGLAERVEITVTPEGTILADGEPCPEGTASLTHIAGEEPAKARRFSLTEFYRRGSELLAMGLLALMAARRYYL